MLDYNQVRQKDRMEHIDMLEHMEQEKVTEKANTGEHINDIEKKIIVEEGDNMKQRSELNCVNKTKLELYHIFNRKKVLLHMRLYQTL